MNGDLTPISFHPDRSTARSRTVGLLVGSAEDKYDNALLRGISDVVQPSGANLICFTSGALRSLHGFEAQRNVLYDLVNADNVDGLIVSGTLAHSVSLADMEDLCRRYQPLPLITVAMQLTGRPSVMVDSGQGMQAVVEHLIATHHYRRIAFVRGPCGQQEAEDRYRAYAEVLTRHNLPIDPDLVLNGDYTYDSGAAALRTLLDRAGVCFDAIVSANDSMALGALDVLHARGVRVPEDVAVTGFDDTEDARFSLPPLTTVRQSAYLQGREAAHLLLDRLQGNEVATVTFVPSTFIVRRSCGCPEQSVALAAVPDTSTVATWHRHEPDQAADIAVTLARAAPLLPFDLAVAWTRRWHEAFVTELGEDRPGLFSETLADLLSLSQNIDDDGSSWHNVLSAQRAMLLPALIEAGQAARAENLWQQARVLIGEGARLRQARWRMQTEQRAATLREISEAMVTSFKLADVLDVIAWELPRLHVTACYLSLFDDPRVSVDQARLILACDRQGRQPLPREGASFPARQLVPPDRLRCTAPYTLVVEALYSKEERLGFVLFEVDAPGSSVCGALRGQLSSALQGVMLLEQRRQAETELQRHQDHLEQLVEARTLALSEANEQLQQEIGERIQAEAEREALIRELETRNAELERFAYTVSHDLKAPLITIRGFLGFVEEEARAGDWDRLAVDMTRIVDATDRMRRLLDELLELSRIGRMMNPSEAMPFALIVQEAIKLTHGRFEASGAQIEIQPDLPVVRGDRVRLVEVVQNLVDNACKFMGGQAEPRITIGCRGSDRDGKPILFVRDNGSGIEPQYHERVFGLFDKLDPHSEGTGVGLALVKRIVEVHGGRIWAESDGVGKGATFCFTLPGSR